MHRLFLLLIGLAFVIPGCARLPQTESLNYRTVEAGGVNDEALAREKHEAALKLISKCQIPAAEQCLHEALLADVSFGPAHNTLGKLYFDQKKFYLAAWEFEYAMKTMPNRAEPVNNLGLVYETVEQIDDAIVQYQTAVEVQPENAQYLGNLLRARVRRGDRSSDMRPMLEQLVLLDSRPSWVNWAKQLLSGTRIDKDFDQFEILQPEFEVEDVDPAMGRDQELNAPLEPMDLPPPMNSSEGNR